MGRSNATGNSTGNSTEPTQYEKMRDRESTLYGTVIVLTAILVGISTLHFLMISLANWCLGLDKTMPLMAFPTAETYILMAAWNGLTLSVTMGFMRLCRGMELSPALFVAAAIGLFQIYWVYHHISFVAQRIGTEQPEARWVPNEWPRPPRPLLQRWRR